MAAFAERRICFSQAAKKQQVPRAAKTNSRTCRRPRCCARDDSDIGSKFEPMRSLKPRTGRPNLWLRLRNRLRMNVCLCGLDLRQFRVGMRPGIEKLAIRFVSFRVLAFLLPSVCDSIQREAGMRTFFEVLPICFTRLLIMPGSDQRRPKHLQWRSRILWR